MTTRVIAFERKFIDADWLEIRLVMPRVHVHAGAETDIELSLQGEEARDRMIKWFLATAGGIGRVHGVPDFERTCLALWQSIVATLAAQAVRS
jgi:hypothetical protein